MTGQLTQPNSRMIDTSTTTRYVPRAVFEERLRRKQYEGNAEREEVKVSRSFEATVAEE